MAHVLGDGDAVERGSGLPEDLLDATSERDSIGATDALRTGSYSKTLTFTLSTTTP